MRVSYLQSDFGAILAGQSARMQTTNARLLVHEPEPSLRRFRCRHYHVLFGVIIIYLSGEEAHQ